MAIYENFVGASRDDFLSLKDAQKNYKLTYKENFNFAYDVLDVLGKTKPDKLAMIWVSNDGEEKRFTFSDMMKMSNKAANYFSFLGIGKGDRVLLVLKRIDALGDCQFRVITENDVQCDVGEEVRIILLLAFIINLVDITNKLVLAVDNLLKLIELRRSLRDVECSVNKSLLVNYYTDDNLVFVHN